MLVLSRKSQEKIRIGDSVVVTILAVKGNSVRVGIEAPRDVRIVRNELQPLDEAAESSEPTTTRTAIVPAPVEDAEEIVSLGGSERFPATRQRLAPYSSVMPNHGSRPR
ncbi:MAG: hypothetical protein DWQ42_10695 [Planctomycetota bacterium]|nr:MAG: hypothetical protein DWQ42_10695 [Planctomycetota bacterium]REK46540.1 MAG: hypothetical protein DWQ46_06610 [Planctomycetota bacterium]